MKKRLSQYELSQFIDLLGNRKCNKVNKKSCTTAVIITMKSRKQKLLFNSHAVGMAAAGPYGFNFDF